MDAAFTVYMIFASFGLVLCALTVSQRQKRRATLTVMLRGAYLVIVLAITAANGSRVPHIRPRACPLSFNTQHMHLSRVHY